MEVSVRAVDKAGDTVDFLLRAHRDKATARRFFERAIERSGAPEKVTIDKSGSNVAALEDMNAGRRKRIVVRQVKYLNTSWSKTTVPSTVNQTNARLQGFSLRRILLSGIRVMHMIRKGQMKHGGKGRAPAQQFYSLAA
ncbi:DDE-type integrase/transposase/recombinase [Granulicella arctica]|uniref:DDE-type integrase/transposase/recombinase n=1 Tax=Granulicella arctica TaxID=940613 RepID=UPI0037BF11C4